MNALRFGILVFALLGLAQQSEGKREEKSNILQVEGGVSDALATLAAELQQQLAMQEKARQDTAQDRSRKEVELRLKEAELVEAEKWYKFWNWPIWSKKVETLKRYISEIKSDIAKLTAVEAQQDTTIGALREGLESKNSAAAATRALEGTIEGLTTQINAKRELLAAEAAEDELEIAQARGEGDAKVEVFARMIADAAAKVASLKEEHSRLLEVHTSLLCSEKEAKQETICARCSASELACGDRCVPSTELCHFDAGCACNGDLGSLIQLSTHPLAERIANAKAAVRAVIAQHALTVQNFEADIAVDEQTKAATELQKQEAIQEFDEAIKQLELNLEQAKGARDQAMASKQKAEADLERVTAEGEEAKAELDRQLAESSARMESELGAARLAHTNEMMANKERIEALKDANAVARNQLSQEIDEMVAARTEAQSTLAAIAGQHL